MRCNAFLVSLTVIVAACSHDTTGETNTTGPTLTIIAGSNITDTISTIPTQALVVRVLGDSGKVAVGAEVRFEAPTQSLMSVGAVSQADFSTLATVLTDATGHATVRVRMNTKSGSGWVTIIVPRYNLVDTARFAIKPGQGVGANIAPKDTLLSFGDVFQFRGGIVDRAGNVTADPVTFGGAGPSFTISPSGTGTANAVALSKVSVRGSLRGTTYGDSTTVLGVPRGLIAWTISPYVLVITDVALSRHRLIVDGGGGPAWEPGGSRLVTTRLPNLMISDSSGSTFPLVVPGFSDATWPEWSVDGWIYFNAGDKRIGRIKPDGTGIQTLAPINSGQMPSPSPDGTSFAYVSATRSTVVVQNVQTGLTRDLAGTEGALTPRWSPDGNWIAYVKAQTPGELMLVRIDGSELHRVGSHGLAPGISWSPDSKWIIGTEKGATLTDVGTGVMTYLSTINLQIYPGWRH